MTDFVKHSQDLNQLQPTPRRTPTAVLWLMAWVVAGGILLLLSARPAPAANGRGAVAASAPPTAGANEPLLSNAALGALQVP